MELKCSVLVFVSTNWNTSSHSSGASQAKLTTSLCRTGHQHQDTLLLHSDPMNISVFIFFFPFLNQTFTSKSSTHHVRGSFSVPLNNSLPPKHGTSHQDTAIPDHAASACCNWTALVCTPVLTCTNRLCLSKVPVTPYRYHRVCQS